MRPHIAIAELDAALERNGQTILLRRLSSGPQGMSVAFEAQMRATVRSLMPADLVAPGAARESVVVISPTGLANARFPGLPVEDDRVIIQGAPSNVKTIAPYYIDDVLVRVKLTCRA